ncbi:MAG: 2-C-methyl-D-erythritol 2,4-cyclodiphosphate synthase [Bacteroidales bacterium]|jgi:2-C-methyl-D-erythritol 2,4-cyclodiphosphate synthase|nr:2-C-methyl-D-erythritol 2,4-cyclodiphosphate synthase [Bacteroidales bacterium]
MKFKVGIGYDVHCLSTDYCLVLGGVKIESDLGSVGHSDADVLLHAIIDALLGASNLRDIGFNYPDNDLRYKGIDSRKLLLDTFNKISNKGYKIENIDSVISLQSPKISAYIPKMQQNIADILHLDEEDITIKATTTEQLGFVGRKEGVSAQAICLLSKDN